MKLIIPVIFLFLFSPNALADGDIERGKVAFQVCAVCHGTDALGSEDFEAPRLQGQHGWYLSRQLENFRGEIRGTHDEDDSGQIMQPMASTLTDQQIDDVVAYILSIK